MSGPFVFERMVGRGQEPRRVASAGAVAMAAELAEDAWARITRPVPAGVAS